jgi:hypothetical protein
MTRATILAAVAALAGAGVASGQTLENRIAAARGTVAFEYETRANVCGDGSSITVSDDSSYGWTTRRSRSGIHMGTRRNRRNREDCVMAPARVLLRRDGGGTVSGLAVTVGGPQDRADTELGDVPAADAAQYLLAIAPRLSGRSGDDALLGAAIADGVVTWPQMLRIARDGGATESVRKSAVFWVSHEAGIAATRGLDSVVTDNDATLSVRSDALFYLSQRPDGEGIPALLRVAETSRSMKLRKDAIWYLAQSRDHRALDLFERLLAR